MKCYCFICLLSVLLLTACASKHGFFEDKHGKYNYEISKSLKNLTVIYGSIYDYQLNKILGNVSGIKFNKSIKWTKNGNFFFTVEPGTYSFKAFGLGFDSLLIKPMKVRARDSIKFLIYLQPDYTPMP